MVVCGRISVHGCEECLDFGAEWFLDGGVVDRLLSCDTLVLLGFLVSPIASAILAADW